MTRQHTFIIAIDGHSACGKSTLAKDLAKSLGILHIDSGAMYRAVSWLSLEKGVDLNDASDIERLLEGIEIDFKQERGRKLIWVNGYDVTEDIRSPQVNDIVSDVAAISTIRKKLVELQKSYGEKESLVMDGRDIGTVVFPDARVKIFLTANIETRVNRRLEELLNKGIGISREGVRKNLESRDHIDSTRKDSPLKKADDAITVDNSNMDRKEQLEYCLEIVKKKVNLSQG